MSDRSKSSPQSSEASKGGRDLASGAVWKTILAMAGPMIFGIAAIKSVSIIDTLYVGQLGEAQLAALSFAFPVTTIIIGLALGLSAGASSVVSRAIGEGEDKRARRMALHDIILAILVTGTVALIGALLTRPIFELLGASEETLGYIVDYMRLWFIAVPFFTFAMVCDFLVRATGNALWPSIIMSAGAVLNIGITALLIFGLWGLPELGIQGAAAGTLIAKVLTALASIWLVTSKTKLVTWTWPKLSEMVPCWIATAKVGVPAAFSNMVHPFTLTIITAILAGFSETIVAAFGVATQVQMLGFIPLLALSSAVSPIAGQNWGAGKPDRIKRTLTESYWLCVAWAAIVAVPLWFFGADLASLFNSDNEIPSKAQDYLRIVPFSLFGYGMVICVAAAFNGIDEAKRALGFNIVRSLLLFLPLSWIGSMVADAPGLYAGIAAGNVISGLLVGWYAIRWLEKNADAAGQQHADQEDDLVPAE